MKNRGIVIHSEQSYGFIEPCDPTQENIFFHKKNLIGRKRLHRNEIVEYEIGQFNERPTALNVSVVPPDSFKTFGELRKAINDLLDTAPQATPDERRETIRALKKLVLSIPLYATDGNPAILVEGVQ